MPLGASQCLRDCSVKIYCSSCCGASYRMCSFLKDAPQCSAGAVRTAQSDPTALGLTPIPLECARIHWIVGGTSIAALTSFIWKGTSDQWKSCAWRKDSGCVTGHSFAPVFFPCRNGTDAARCSFTGPFILSSLHQYRYSLHATICLQYPLWF